MSNKRINKAYIRYDGTGRVIPGSLILNRFKPQVGNWKETPAYECCNFVNPNYTLRLLFDDIANANALVGDAANVADWNTFFDLPAYGNPFTSVTIVGDEVRLTGGYNIETKFRLFSDYDHLLEVNDDGALVILGDETFGGENGTSSLIGITAPNVTTTICEDPNNNFGVFGQCYNLIHVYLPNCVNLGAVTFYECEILPQSGLTLPFDQITSIRPYTFDYCYGLTELNYPSLLTIDTYGFSNCSGITSVNLPSLISVNDGAFDSCTSITSFSIPNLTTTNGSPFGNCISVTDFDFPLLTTINDIATFAGCASVTTFNLPVCTQLGQSVDDNILFIGIIGNTITLTIPAALMTCNGGQPDGDIQFLQTNDTLTVITV